VRIYVKLKRIIIVEEKKEDVIISIRAIKSWDTFENTFALTIAQSNLEMKVI
jgi:hypothetical protein